MELPVTLLTWLGAALPIAALLVLLVRFNLPVVEAAAASVVLSMVVALGLYKAPLVLVAGQLAKGVWNALPIIAVIFPAILVYELGTKSNAYAAIQKAVTGLIPDRLLQVLALGWCFSSFLQGPSGFGVPVAVAAPLMVGIGVKPLYAVLIPLMAHAWGSTFGTLAMGWDTMLQQVAMEPSEIPVLAFWSALFIGCLNAVTGAMCCWFYGGWKAMRHGWPAVAVLAVVMGVGQLVLAQYIPALSAVIPTTVSLGVVMLLGRAGRYRSGSNAPASPVMEAPREELPEGEGIGFHEALLPYYLLVGISLAVLLTPPVSQALGAWKVGISVPAMATGYGFTNPASDMYGPTAWLTHSGLFLLVSALLAMGYYLRSGALVLSDGGEILVQSLRKFVPAAVSVVFLVAMSKVMSGSGQIMVLASGTAAVTGPLYGVLSPMVGALGAFMSSSNVSSNILFSQFQSTMAGLTGYSESVVLGAQTSGGAMGTMISPSRVLLGTTTVGILGMEGRIIKKLLPVALGAGVLIGVLTFVFGRM